MNPAEPGGERLHDVAVEPDGTIVGVGDVAPGPRLANPRSPRRRAALVLAWRPDGRPDRSFGRRGSLVVTGPGSAYTGFGQVESLPSGRLLVSGYVGGRPVLYRLTADGRIDRSFGDGGRAAVGRIARDAPRDVRRAPFAVDRHGRIVLAGMVYRDSVQDAEPVVLVRLSADGRRDRSFGRSVYAEQAPVDRQPPLERRRHVEYYHFAPKAIAIDGHGRIVVAGKELAPYTRGQEEPGHEAFSSRRFLPNGRRDRGFGHGGVLMTDPPGSRSMALAALTRPDGRVVAGGWVRPVRHAGEGPAYTAMMLTRYR